DASGQAVPLVLASAETVPFAASSFDTVFCDHGAMSFADPARTVPEAARVLRPGGLLAFCATHPLVYLTWNDAKERQTRKLQVDYADLGRMDTGEGPVDWAVPPGRWCQFLRDNVFYIETLSEFS